MSTFLHEAGTCFSWWSRRQWREEDTHATTLGQDLGICWLGSLAQKKRSSALGALAVSIVVLASRKRKSCLHHRSDSVEPELKLENPTPFLDTNSAFTEANVRCQHAWMKKDQWKKEENHPLPSGSDPEHWDISLWVNVWRVYLLVDDKTTPKWPCSCLKHPDVWEVQSGALLMIFYLYLSFWGQNCWMNWLNLVLGGKKLFFTIPCQGSTQEFNDGSNQKFYYG